MLIKKIETFKYQGREFSNLDKIRVEVENAIGKIIDSMSTTLSPDQKLDILEGVISNREELTQLLNTTFEGELDGAPVEEQNILFL